jgi:hypothetical protein
MSSQLSSDTNLYIGKEEVKSASYAIVLTQLTSHKISLIVGRLLGSFWSSHRIKRDNSGEVVCGEGGTTGDCRIFMISAYWFLASNGCAKVQHYKIFSSYREIDYRANMKWLTSYISTPKAQQSLLSR